MSWSTRMVSAPVCSGMCLITSVRWLVSSSGSPAAGSSSSISRGLSDDRAGHLYQAALPGPSVPTFAPGRASSRRTRSRRARPRGGRSRRAWSVDHGHVVEDGQLLDGLLGLERAPHAPPGAAEVRHRQQVGAERAHRPRRPAGRSPLSTLKNVVLPAPFGPMSPQVPASNVRLMASSEVTPPYRTVRPRPRSWDAPLPGALERAGARRSAAAEVRQVLRDLVGQAAGAVVSTCSTPRPNRIVSQSAETPSCSAGAGRSCIAGRDDRPPQVVGPAHQDHGQHVSSPGSGSRSSTGSGSRRRARRPPPR